MTVVLSDASTIERVHAILESVDVLLCKGGCSLRDGTIPTRRSLVIHKAILRPIKPKIGTGLLTP